MFLLAASCVSCRVPSAQAEPGAVDTWQAVQHWTWHHPTRLNPTGQAGDALAWHQHVQLSNTAHDSQWEAHPIESPGGSCMAGCTRVTTVTSQTVQAEPLVAMTRLQQ